MMIARRLMPGDGAEALVVETAAIAESLKPVLAGHDPRAIGAALADMTAMWLAGHVLLEPDKKAVNRKATKRMREAHIRAFIGLVHKLTPENARMIEAAIVAGATRPH